MLPWRLPAVSPSFVAPDHRLVSDGTLVADAALGHRSVHNGLQTQHIGENSAFRCPLTQHQAETGKACGTEVALRGGVAGRCVTMGEGGRCHDAPSSALLSMVTRSFRLDFLSVTVRRSAPLWEYDGSVRERAARLKPHTASCTRHAAPDRPPTAAPIANGVEIDRSICDSCCTSDLPTDQHVMPRTVHPDRKLISVTCIIPSASSAGLMITPPPIPHILPMIQAPNATRKQILCT